MDWIGRLDWWTLTLKIIFMLSNETHLPTELHDALFNPITPFFLHRLARGALILLQEVKLKSFTTIREPDVSLRGAPRMT